MSKTPKGGSLEVLYRDAGDPLIGQQAERLTLLGQALSDPIRVKMLGMMAAGRECCSLPESGVPEEDMGAGLCVCEFEAYFGMGQSKVSYHMKKLKDAGLVREEKRGRWNYYSIDKSSVEESLSSAREVLTRGDACC